jgi:hypothetical protein
VVALVDVEEPRLRQSPRQRRGFVQGSGHVGPALKLVARLVFSYDRWLLFVPLVLVAAIAALTVRGFARELALAYLVTVALLVSAFTWILWTFNMQLDEAQSSAPIPRAVGSVVLLSTVLAPLLIHPLLPPRHGAEPPSPR